MKFVFPAVAAFTFLLPVACRRSEAPVRTATPHQQVLDTMVVHPHEVNSQLGLPAHVIANPTQMVHIYPMISGRVLSLRVLPGQEVHKGEKIGTLQSSQAAQARSDFEKAKIEAARADLQLARAQELLAHDVLAQRDYDDLKALDETDHSELERALQALHLLGFSEHDTSDIVPILAPISGTVTDVGTGAGEMQRSLDNATAIATIANIDSIWVVGDLYPRDLDEVHVGQPAEITVNGYPGQVFHGKVDNISSAVDPTTLTMQVRVVLPNRGHRLKPDMYANMALTGPGRNAIVIPATAVIRNGNDVYVFVETAPGKYQRRDVTLGATQADSDEILHGLNDGDRVVTGGAELLRQSEER